MCDEFKRIAHFVASKENAKNLQKQAKIHQGY